MNNALTKLEFNGMPVRIELINDEPWFVAMDLCAVLGIANSRDAFQRLDDDEKDIVGVTDTIGRQSPTQVVNESGMYNLVFRSMKPQAQQFKRWVTHEVLPALRKTGQYEMKLLPTTSPVQQNTLAAAKQLLLVAEEHETRLDRLENRQAELEARPSLGSPPEGILFPKYRPDHLRLGEYMAQMGKKLTTHELYSASTRIARYCRKLGIFYEANKHGNRYPIPVLQEFFR
jgi:prophage antirepressor-like protein